MKVWPTDEPQDGSSEPADHAHQLELVHDGKGPVFPPLCPHCGAAASRRMSVRKVYGRTNGESTMSYPVGRMKVPFCDRCIAQHENEVQKLNPLQLLVVSFATAPTIAAVGAGVMVFLLLPDALRELESAGFPWLLAVVAFFMLIALISLAGSWHGTAHRRVPPPTSITRSFDFSARHAELFEAPRMTYAIRNDSFADAFIELNQERIWNPRSPAARRAKRARKRLLQLASAVVIAIFLWELAGDLFGG